MTFFENVKSIIPPSVSKSCSDFEVKLNFSVNTGDKEYHISRANAIVTIYVNKLPPKKKRSLKKAIKESFETGNLFLIEDDKTELLNRLYQYDDKNDLLILAFFKRVLSNMDWEALRDSLFLRNQFKKKIPVGGLKNDIKQRYGERGNTISNLCTAGYFEETMIPLYNSDPTEFWRYWDIAIDRGITALFVNAGMKIEKVTSEIKRIIGSAKAYGLTSIHIHGIGDINIQKIKDCIENEKENLGFTENNVFIDEKLHVLVVEIILPKAPL